jgi:hypothetical protein
MSTQFEILIQSIEKHLIEVEALEYREKILKLALKSTIERMSNSKEMASCIDRKRLQDITVEDMREIIKHSTRKSK